MKQSFLALVAFAFFLLPGCVVKDYINLAYTPNVDKPQAGQQFATVFVKVADERPYVHPGAKEPYFIGIFKNTFGVPMSARATSDEPLSARVRSDLCTELASIGVSVVESTPEKEVVVVINDYNFECYRDCRVWHNITVKIKDAKTGRVLYEGQVKDEQVVVHNNPFIGPQSTMQKELPKIYASMIKNLIRNSPDAMKAMSNDL